jgi:hypothetical protein
VNQSEQIGELAKALSKAQGEIEGAIEKSDNPFFKSKYADLHTVMKSCKQQLADNGLSVVMTYEVNNDKNYLVTRLLHSSGQWIKGEMLIPVAKPDAQSLGAATTYCRRFALSALVGISTFDDDGEEASKPFREEKSRHMQRPVEPMNMSIAGSTQLPSVDHSTVRLQKAVCATGNLVGEDDVTRFLEYLVEKYPKKTRADLIASALSTDEKVAQFSSSMKEWKDRPASLA